MAHKKGGPSNRLLTEVELELMTIIWRGGGVTVKDVVAALPEGRALAYTSVATVMKILEQKGFLSCKKDAHAHSYTAQVRKDEYERECVDHMVNNVFGGEPVALVQRLLDARNLSVGDLQSLQAALKQLGAERKRESR
jgi:predicted transcriptional regulator